MGTYLFGALSKHMAYTYMEQQAQLKKRFEDKRGGYNRRKQKTNPSNHNQYHP